MEAKFKVGDPVYKPKGYGFAGSVVAVVDMDDIGVRYIVRQGDMSTALDNGKIIKLSGGALHIFSEEQLELAV